MMCFVHESVAGRGLCRACGRALCEECATDDGHGLTCAGPCAEIALRLDALLDSAEAHGRGATGALRQTPGVLAVNGGVYALAGGSFVIGGMIVSDHEPEMAAFATWIEVLGGVFLLAGAASLLLARRLKTATHAD